MGVGLIPSGGLSVSSGQVYSLDFCVAKSSTRPDRKGLSRRLINGFGCGDTRGSLLPSRSDNATGLEARTFSYSISHQCNMFTVTSMPGGQGFLSMGGTLERMPFWIMSYPK